MNGRIRDRPAGSLSRKLLAIIRIEMENLGLSQADIAKKMNYDQGTVSKMLDDKFSYISIDPLDELVKILPTENLSFVRGFLDSLKVYTSGTYLERGLLGAYQNEMDSCRETYAKLDDIEKIKFLKDLEDLKKRYFGKKETI